MVLSLPTLLLFTVTDWFWTSWMVGLNNLQEILPNLNFLLIYKKMDLLSSLAVGYMCK